MLGKRVYRLGGWEFTTEKGKSDAQGRQTPHLLPSFMGFL